jgi:hypothetical protein
MQYLEGSTFLKGYVRHLHIAEVAQCWKLMAKLRKSITGLRKCHKCVNN